MPETPAAITIHAADNWCEEGVLADSAVFRELQCNPVAVVTSVIAAAPDHIDALDCLSLSLVAQQFESVMKGCRPTAGRTGILTDPRQIELVAGLVREYGIHDMVVAPVLRFGGYDLLDRTALEATRRLLYPVARVLVVRAGDVTTLSGVEAEGLEGMKKAAAILRNHGAVAVLLAGFPYRGRVLDLLDDQGSIAVFDASRIITPRVSGLAGAHAAALTAHLARGESLAHAAAAAQRYVGFRLQRGR
jgi:hydroxymethylpyrimidine/phosphomethylpyrimidine kinase